jgi:hypothetical protein
MILIEKIPPEPDPPSYRVILSADVKDTLQKFIGATSLYSRMDLGLTMEEAESLTELYRALRNAK